MGSVRLPFVSNVACLALFGSGGPMRDVPQLGEDRKWSAVGRTDAIDRSGP